MSDWSDFQRENSARITGKLRCVITEVEEKVSKKGNPMFEIKVRPSGCRFTVKTWLVHGIDGWKEKATRFFDAFPEIEFGNFDCITWVGAEGAAIFDEDDNGYLNVKRWLDPVQAADLPPYEGNKPERQTVTTLAEDEGPDDDLPFV